MSRLMIESGYSIRKTALNLRGFDAPANRYTWALFSSSTTGFQRRLLRMFRCSVSEKDYDLSKYSILCGDKNTRDYFECEWNVEEDESCNEMDTQSE